MYYIELSSSLKEHSSTEHSAETSIPSSQLHISIPEDDFFKAAITTTKPHQYNLEFPLQFSLKSEKDVSPDTSGTVM
jgi:hypothetical protein